MLIRSSESAREFARGVGDSYRQVINGVRVAPMGRGKSAPPPDGSADDALLRAAPCLPRRSRAPIPFGPIAPMDRAALVTGSR
jgi:hypothetical protein